MKILFKSKISILNFGIAFSAFLMNAPYFTWNTYQNAAYVYLPHIVIALTIAVWFLNDLYKIKIKKYDLFFSFYFFILSLYLCVEYENKTISIGGLVLAFLVVIYLLMDINNKISIYKTYSYIFAFSIAIGLLPYILTLFNFNLYYDILIPNHIIKEASGLYYRKIWGTIILFTPPMLRFSAMYDEPGVIGTMCALFLAVDSFKLKNNYKNIIFFIGGVLSFSNSFFIMSSFWYLSRLITSADYKKIFLLLIFIVMILNLHKIQTSFAPLDRVFSSTRVVNGRLLADNRLPTNTNTHSIWKDFYESQPHEIFFGKGRGWANNNPNLTGGWSYDFLILDHGVLGFLNILLWLVSYVLYINRKHKNIYVYLLSIIFVLSIYQRPYVMNIQYLIILIGGSLFKIYNDNFLKEENVHD